MHEVPFELRKQVYEVFEQLSQSEPGRIALYSFVREMNQLRKQYVPADMRTCIQRFIMNNPQIHNDRREIQKRYREAKKKRPYSMGKLGEQFYHHIIRFAGYAEVLASPQIRPLMGFEVQLLRKAPIGYKYGNSVTSQQTQYRRACLYQYDINSKTAVCPNCNERLGEKRFRQWPNDVHVRNIVAMLCKDCYAKFNELRTSPLTYMRNNYIVAVQKYGRIKANAIFWPYIYLGLIVVGNKYEGREERIWQEYKGLYDTFLGQWSQWLRDMQ